MTASDFLAILGRLHPLVLHLPIGLLVGLGAVEAVSVIRRRDSGQGVAVLVWLNAAAGVTAAVTGFVLSRESGYAGGEAWGTIDTHMWLGIAVGVCGVLLAAAHARRVRLPDRGGAGRYRMVLALTLALLLPTGHLGGEMTHGAGFVLEPLREREGGDPVLATVELLDRAASGVTVQPLLTAYCISCHGSDKRKGGLALHTADAIASGGDSGPVIVPGDAAASELLCRLRLPLDHDDRMPPAGKRQPSAAEIDALAAWINSAGAIDGWDIVGGEGSGGPAEVGGEPGVGGAETAADVPEPDPGAIERLRGALVHAQPVQQGSRLLCVDFRAPASAGGIDDAAAASLLEPLVEHVADLSLAGSDVTDAIMAIVARMPRLGRLDLRGCGVTDAGVVALASHSTLEELNLVGTRVTDAAVEPLLAMPALARLYIWRSGISAEGAARLHSRPGLHVETGDVVAAAAIEVEPTPRLTSDAPLPGSASASTPLPTPTNSTCPVSGKPVDPRYQIVHEGKVIGLCCPKCAEAYWEGHTSDSNGPEDQGDR